MLKKISLSLILILGLVVLAGCSSTEVTTESPSSSSEKVTPAARTFVPKGMNAEGYLKKYYDLYTEGKFSESYKMLPATKKKSQTVEEYTSAHKSLPVDSYELGAKKESGTTTTIDVKLKLKKYGTWTTTWTFEKDKDGLVVYDYSAAGSGGSGGSAPH